MRFLRAVASGVLALVLLGPGTAETTDLPLCRIRVGPSGPARISRQLVREVESWVDVPERGCSLVDSIAGADVFLELHDYDFTVTADEVPVHKWWFIARRLGEPRSEGATHRFAFFTMGSVRQARGHVSRRLPVVLKDVCLGILPEPSPPEAECR